MSMDLDRAMAVALTEPSSGSILSLMREIRSDRAKKLQAGDIAAAQSASALYTDCSHLYKSALVLESDPEIVSRNTLARVLAGISPFIQAIEEVKSLHQKSFWDLLLEAGSIITEVASASQYLESAKLATEAHFKDSLLPLEERMAEMAEETSDPLGNMEKVSSFMDSVSGLEIPVEAKPFVPFVLWMILVIIDYKLYSME